MKKPSNLVKCDIAIIGAGAAGIAAAVAAAESGLQVILVEKYGFTGGIASAAMVGTLCGLFYRNSTPARYAVQGFARDFAEGIMTKNNRYPETFAEGLVFLPYQIHTFHQQAIEKLEQAGVRLLLHSQVFQVFVEAEKVTDIRINAAEGIFSLHPQAIVDCSGNAQISRLAGLEMIEQRQYQSSAFVFQVDGLPKMEPRLLALNMIRWIKRGIDEGELDRDCERLSIIPGTVNQGRGLFKLGLPEILGDDSRNLTDYELLARSRSTKIVKYLRCVEKSLEDLNISMMATEVGIRSDSRSQGIDVLEESHILACAKPDDGVAIGAWPIEYWGNNRKPEMTYFGADDFYLIPAGTLVSKHLDNLFFAGKAMSATERAIASARVIGTCLGTGYAAGMLAVESVKEGEWQSAIKKIRQKQVVAEEA